MQSKTYRAKTMKEALTRVRRDLGGDAVILSAREVRRRRLFGLGPRALVEIVATDTMPSEQDFTGGRRSAATASSPASAGVSVQVGEQLGRLHAMVETLSRNGHIEHLLPDLPRTLVPTYSLLIEADVPEVLTHRLMRHIADTLDPDQFDRPDAIRAALMRSGRAGYPDCSADQGRRRHAPGRRLGGPHWCR